MEKESNFPLASRDLNRAVLAMDQGAVRLQLQAIAGAGSEILKNPETGMVMMNVKDCFNTDFHLGEILVTTAELRIQGKRGWGMVMGDDGDRALLLAGLDVIFREEIEPLATELYGEIERWKRKADEELVAERKRTAVTRVNFQNMVVG